MNTRVIAEKPDDRVTEDDFANAVGAVGQLEAHKAISPTKKPRENGAVMVASGCVDSEKYTLEDSRPSTNSLVERPPEGVVGTNVGTSRSFWDELMHLAGRMDDTQLGQLLVTARALLQDADV